MSRSRSLRLLSRAGGALAGGLVLAGTVLAVHAQSPMPPSPPPAVREGISLAGVPVGGRSREEVARVAGALKARLLGYPVEIRAGRSVERTTPAKLGGTVDAEGAVARVLALSAQEPGLLERLRQAIAGPAVREVPLPVRFTEEGVRAGLRRFAGRIGEPPRNARLTKIDGVFRSFPPRPGRELDVSRLIADLQAALDAPEVRAACARAAAAALETPPPTSSPASADADPSPAVVQAVTRVAAPRVLLEHLAPITHTLAVFRTSLGGSSRNRIHNVNLACRAIDGTVLLPGDVFSYNDTVGPRVAAAGYREAPVIVRGELQPGTGGGICQVSSTLYNAALLADLEIVRRRHHAIPVHYLPPGRDATVVDGLIDFRFRNRLEHPIALDCKVVGRQVVVRIYGHPADRREVEIVRSGLAHVPAEYRTVPDPKLPRGRRIVEKPAQSGRRVTVSRIVRKNGQVIRREVVSRDYYRPYPGVVRVGTRAPASPQGTDRPDVAEGRTQEREPRRAPSAGRDPARSPAPETAAPEG